MYGPQIVDVMGAHPYYYAYPEFAGAYPTHFGYEPETFGAAPQYIGHYPDAYGADPHDYMGADPRAQAAVHELMQGDPSIIGAAPRRGLPFGVQRGGGRGMVPHRGGPPMYPPGFPNPGVQPYPARAYATPRFALPGPQGAAVVDKPATTRYDRALPIRQDNVAIGATVAITARPQVLFTPDRYIIPSNIAQGFDVLDIVIATVSMLVGNQGAGLPGRFFQENVDVIKLKWPTLTPGMDVNVSVANVSGAILTYKSAFFGVSAM